MYGLLFCGLVCRFHRCNRDDESAHQELNLEPDAYKTPALTVELWADVHGLAVSPAKQQSQHDAYYRGADCLTGAEAEQRAEGCHPQTDSRPDTNDNEGIVWL